MASLQKNGCKETGRFIQLVLQMWNCLNVKHLDTWYHLNDANRKPVYHTDDTRLTFLVDMATLFKKMDTYSASSQVRTMDLTTDTSNALHVTLNGLVSLVSQLLGKITYVLMGEFQSDRIEAEFGINRQQNGGNFHISVQQALNSTKLQQLKLYKNLDIPSQSSHCEQECYSHDLSTDGLFHIDNCFSNSSKVDEIERSSLYYVSGYIAHNARVYQKATLHQKRNQNL